MIDNAGVDALIDWMVDGARPSANADEIIDTICRRLVGCGVPIDRFALFIYTLHPNIAGRRYLWTPGGGVEMAEGQIGLFQTDDYLKNPLPGVVQRQQAVRRKLVDPGCPNDYQIIDELRGEGFTDYFAQPLIYTTGETNAASWSSKAPAGFDDRSIAALERVNAPLARLTETYLLRLNAATLLSTYVGYNSGERILQGSIHRGDGQEIEAVLLFADIIDFTRISNSMDGPDIVAMLNGTFDLLVPPVETHGGEILKFMGDGFLAIFPIDAGAGTGNAVERACAAVAEGEAALAGSELGRIVAFRSAIHMGRFHYGNVGGAGRLDFTAIGAAVNYAARLLAAGPRFERRRVISQEAAGLLGGRASMVGELAFKGFDGTHPVYTY